jgi:hypothetical protein
MQPTRAFTLPAGLSLALWLTVSLLVGLSGVLATSSLPLPQITIAALVLILTGAYAASKAFRDWLGAIPLMALVGIHLVRFVGFYFLWLHARGELPGSFAEPAGWGDIAVATSAVLLLLAEPKGRRAYLAWNTLGSIDILFVVLNATRLAISDPASLSALQKLPLSLLPTFVVPLIIFSHIVIFLRLRILSPAKENARSGR